MKRSTANGFSEGILFFESGAAAVSLKNFWTKLASTYGCMEISLSHRYLTIRPRRIVSWLIIPFKLDLNHTIMVSEITSVTEKGKSLSYRGIRISFRDSEYKERALILYLRNGESFLEELRKLGVRSE